MCAGIAEDETPGKNGILLLSTSRMSLESNSSAPSKSAPSPPPPHYIRNPTLCSTTCPPFSSLRALVSLLPPNLCLCYYISLALSCQKPSPSLLSSSPSLKCTLSLSMTRAALPFSFAVLTQVLLDHLKNAMSTTESPVLV